jgi:ABC-type bacteriocin/lantibiotic exporter with double-glycine peptidase domain
VGWSLKPKMTADIVTDALYHNPEMLVLDEATSALDSQTKKDVMEAVAALRGTMTIVMVAHRLCTLAHGDSWEPCCRVIWN